MIALRDYQEDAVNLVRASYAGGKRAPLLVLPTGGGKCLAAGTPVLMYDGRIKPVEMVQIGDLVMGADSTPRRVLSLARGREQMYRITPTKGDPYTVNESHILSLRITGGSSLRYKPDEVVNISVRDYLKQTKTFKHCAKGWRTAVEFSEKKFLPLPPYILGAWLGDGNSSQMSITTGDYEVAREFYDFVSSVGMQVRTESNSVGSANMFAVGEVGKRGAYGRGGNPLVNILRKLRLLDNKHVPHDYKTASREQRLELLAGLLDTDGSYTGKGYDLCLKSENLLDDAIFVARSLGFSAYKATAQKKCYNTGAVGTYYRCSISGDVEQIPCRLPHKKAAPRKQKKNVLRMGITVEPVGEGDYYGFELDGDRLFLLGDFTVTHNTTIFAYVATGAGEKGRCVFILAHRQELIKQISATLARFGTGHQIVAPGKVQRSIMVQQFKNHGRTFIDAKARIYVCSVQTLAKRMHLMRDVPDLIVCDEAHHMTRGSTWGNVVDNYPEARLLLVTATPIRLDGKGLGIGHGGYADDIIVGAQMRWLIDNGYLCDYRVFAPPIQLDLKGIRSRAGDYANDQLAAAMDKPSITGDVVKHYQKIAPGKRAIVFCVSVAHGKHVAEQFKAAGISAAFLDAADENREKMIADFESGAIQVLTSCDIVSEGFDLPAIEVAILLRPTKSTSLYLQQVGRALRPFAGKPYAIIIDHVGAVATHGLPDEEREWTLDGLVRRKRSPKDDETPDVGLSVCPECFAEHRPAKSCPNCGHVYRAAERSIEQVDGELVEITAAERAAMRQLALEEKAKKAVQRKKEERDCRTLDDFIQLAKERNYQWPEQWAKRRMQFRSGASRY